MQQLTLVATNGIAGNIDFDHADWAGAILTTTPPVQQQVVVGAALSKPVVKAAAMVERNGGTLTCDSQVGRGRPAPGSRAR